MSRSLFVAAAAASLALVPQGQLEPYQGIRLGNSSNLYPLKTTGVSTQPIQDSVRKLLSALDPAQQKAISFALDSDLWRRWDNRTGAQRHGLRLADLTESQKQLALGVMAATLSAKGFEKSRDSMRLDETLAELTKRPNYGEWQYWLSIFGTPSPTEPWGWQIDGHHLCINAFIIGDQIVMTPTFMGAEPAIATSGKYMGTKALQEEQQKGMRLMWSLEPDQYSAALIKGDKGMVDNVAEAFHDNLDLSFVGIPATKLSKDQKALLLSLIREYVGNIRDGHAKVKMSEVERHLNETYFAWIGGTTEDSVFYYRIQSPVILIEFDHQRPAALGGGGPTRQHVHTVVRTPNGNDYGKDLLRQHLAKHSH